MSIAYLAVFTEAESFRTGFTKLNSANNAWYVESAAIQHMTNHREWWITDYIPFVAQTWGIQVAHDTIICKGAGEVIQPN